MILLIDAGNTRIKWGMFDTEGWLEQGVLGHGDTRALELIAQRTPGLTRALGANVAGVAVKEAIGRALSAANVGLDWIQTSSSCCGVHNLYDTPAQLGVDRWAALIGARSHCASACLVVTAGTATTIDVLAQDGCFLGGAILPGERLMRHTLADNTAQLPLAEGHYMPTPRNTADAIVSGCLNAQVGAIQVMYRQIEGLPGATCLLNGGGSANLEPLLTIPFARTGNLVLDGLSVIARQRDSGSG